MNERSSGGENAYFELLNKLLTAQSVNSLNFIIANESVAAWDFVRTYVLEKSSDNFEILTISGMVEVNKNTPAYASLIGWMKARVWSTEEVIQDQIPSAVHVDDEYLAALLCSWIMVVPLGSLHAGRERYWVLTGDVSWNLDQTDRAKLIGNAYAQRWVSLQSRKSRLLDRFKHASSRYLMTAVFGLGLLMTLVQVPATVSAPAEIVPLNPHVVTAPQDGVVREVLVRPNSSVTSGQLLFVLDNDVVLNRRKIAEESLNIAKTDALIASQRAFSDDRSKADLNIALGRIAEKEAELKAIDAQISKIDIRSDRRGIAVFNDPNEWRGRPVQTGEKIMQIAQSEDAGVLVWLGVSDALNLVTGSQLSLYLHIDPLVARKAEVIEMAYLPEVGPDSVSSYRVRARFIDGMELPRLGLRGVARLYGENVSLGYYLFRRPVAYMWRHVGWLL